MRIDHIALWTTDLERCKQFYVAYFGAVPGAGYVNAMKGFTSCFLSFSDGVRIGLPVIDGPRRTGDGYYESVVLEPDGNRIEIMA